MSGQSIFRRGFKRPGHGAYPIALVEHLCHNAVAYADIFLSWHSL